jgi:hypothetical protein
MSTLRLLSIVFDDAQDVQYAIIELIDEDIKQLAVRRKAFLAAKEADPDLIEQVCRSHDATFYTKLYFQGESGEVPAFKVAGDDHILFLADKDEVFTERSETASVGMDMLAFDEHGVHWRSHSKYGGGTFRSETVDWSKLFEGRL